MDALFKLFDRLTETLPHSTVQMIRLGGVLVWLVLGTIVIYYAWSAGGASVPPSGQDLSRARVREKIERQRHLENPPPLDLRERDQVIIPDTGEFRGPTQPALPYRREGGKTAAAPPKPGSVDSTPRRPFSEGRQAGPPYVGEDPSLYPNRGTAPRRDPGSGGVRDSRGSSVRSGSGSGVPRGPSPEPRAGLPQRPPPSVSPARSGTSPSRSGEQGPSLYPRTKKGPPGLLPPGERP